jgi:hypothetical protein
VTGCILNTVAGSFARMAAGMAEQHGRIADAGLIGRGLLPVPLPHPLQARPSLFGSA